jgi:hypothetical protein
MQRREINQINKQCEIWYMNIIHIVLLVYTALHMQYQVTPITAVAFPHYFSCSRSDVTTC